MSWLHIVHDTTYSYKKAVRFGPHRLVIRPREGHDVRIEGIRVEIEPTFDLEWSRDLFGNCVATACILSPAEHLRIHSEVLLHQTAPFPMRPPQRETRTEFPVHFSENGVGALPQCFYQFLIPAHVPHFIGQVRPMRLDEMRFELFALSDDAPGVKQRPFLLEEHEPEKHGEEARVLRGPAQGRHPCTRRLDKIEMTRSIELRRALLIQSPEHFRMLLLFLQELAQTFCKQRWQRKAQQGFEYLSSDGGFEKYDLLVEVDRLELVVAKPLLLRQHSIGWRVMQRRKFLGDEAFPVIHGRTFNKASYSEGAHSVAAST